MDESQQSKEAIRSKFAPKLDEILDAKNTSTLKTDENYAEIVSAVREWNKGERFPKDHDKRNYGAL
jgi:hypothetical protein